MRTSIPIQRTRSTRSGNSRADSTGEFILAIAVAVLVFWAAALIRTLLNFALVRKLGDYSAAVGLPSLSVVIPARNEEQVIGKTVRALLAQNYPRFDVIVVDDRSTDSTASTALAAAAEDSRVQLVAGTEPPDGWLGKPWALQQGALASTADVLLFIDADVIYDDAEALRLAVDALVAEDASLLTLFPRLIMRGFWENIAMPQLAVIAYVFLPIWLANRTRWKTLGVGGGPGNLIWRAVWKEIGGHERLKDAVIDDVALARAVRAEGKRTVIVRADEHIELRMYRGLREIIEGFTKNAFQVVGGFSGTLVAISLTMVVHLLPYFWFVKACVDVASHRTVSIAVSAGAASVFLIAAARLLVFVSLRYGIANALLGHPLMVLVWSYVMLRSAWFVGVKKRIVWRGRSYETRNTRFGG